MSCSLKSYNIITYVLKLFLFGRFCGSFQFIPQSPVVFPAFFIVDILPFPSLTHFTIISCVIHGFLALFSTLPTKSLIVSGMHSFILFHCTSALPLSHSIKQSLPSRVTCTLCLWAYSFSKSHLDLLFWNLIIFFHLVRNLANSKLWSEPISAPGSVCTSFTLFLNQCFTRM